MNEPIDLQRVRRALAGLSPASLDLPRRAAVAVVLSGQPSAPTLLLVRRSDRASDPWSGHMALPGGHAEPRDAGLLQTVRRETLEEVGVELGAAELLGQLDDLSPLRSSDISVRPFVFWLGELGRLRFSNEVAEALNVPLADLASGRLSGFHEVDLGGVRETLPAFLVEQRAIWGMTFRILQTLIARILRPAGSLDW